MNFIPNVSPTVFTMSAVLVGFLLIDDTSTTEQNALGNWLMLVGQVLETNASHQWNQEARGVRPVHPRDQGGESPNKSTTDFNTQEMICLLNRTVAALEKEIENLKM